MIGGITMYFKHFSPEAISDNVFHMIGDEWMLITAGDRNSCNTMTASWGSMGILWNKPVVHIFVRPQRYTYAFLEQQDMFTLSVFESVYRPQLQLCGTKSGRDLDKISACGFTVTETENGTPYFGEARLVFVCKKLYWHDIHPERFLDRELKKHYPLDDYHREYIGEILDVLVKTEE